MNYLDTLEAFDYFKDFRQFLIKLFINSKDSDLDLLDDIEILKSYDDSCFDEFGLLCFMEELDGMHAEAMINNIRIYCPQLADSLAEVFLFSRDLIQAEQQLNDIGCYDE